MEQVWDIAKFKKYYGTITPRRQVERMIARSKEGPLTEDIPLVAEVIEMMRCLQEALANHRET